MSLLLAGIAILAAVLGLIYLKDRLQSPTLARVAFSELNMRFAVIGAALVVIGVVMMLGELFT